MVVHEMPLANESQRFETYEDYIEEAKQFVRNLGVLLSQTRLGIANAEMDDEEVVTLRYDDGYEVKYRVCGDSFIAMIEDTLRNIHY